MTALRALWHALFPERCVETMLALASRAGATLRTRERVTAWRATGDSVELDTDRGRVHAARLILAAGPWLPTLVPELELPLEIERQLFHWFAPRAHAEWYDADHSPIALWEYAPDRLFATFPDVGHGLKTGVHHEGAATAADAPRAPVSDEETASMRALLARFCPDAAGSLLDCTTCLYTNTPDHDFLIDVHPAHPQVILASPCSGHGFKFASAIGELLADLALAGATAFDREPFRIARFGRTPVRSPQSSTGVPMPRSSAR